MPKDRVVERLARCVTGLLVCGLGIVLIIDADLGVAPWDVLHQGISGRVGLPIGTVILIVGAVVLALWWPLRMRPGLGTILNAVLIGIVVDVVDPLVPELHRPAAQVVALVSGIAALGVGSGLYIGSGLGAGPRDGLMTGLAARGYSIRLTRTAIEVVALVLGWTLGGSVGIGTAVFALSIGPLVHVLVPVLTVDQPARVAPTPAVAIAG